MHHTSPWNSEPLQHIGIDMDDVLFDFNENLHAYCNKKYGSSIRRSDITTYEIEKVWDCSREEAGKRIFEFYYTPEHHKSQTIPGSTDVIEKLAKHKTLHIITSRVEDIKDITIDWLEKHFPSMFQSVNFTGLFSRDNDNTLVRKSDICKKLGIKIMIEDSMSNAQDLSSSGIAVLLLDNPWNQGPVPPGVHRVYSWQEIGDIVLS